MLSSSKYFHLPLVWLEFSVCFVKMLFLCGFLGVALLRCLELLCARSARFSQPNIFQIIQNCTKRHWLRWTLNTEHWTIVIDDNDNDNDGGKKYWIKMAGKKKKGSKKKSSNGTFWFSLVWLFFGHDFSRFLIFLFRLRPFALLKTNIQILFQLFWYINAPIHQYNQPTQQREWTYPYQKIKSNTSKARHNPFNSS